MPLSSGPGSFKSNVRTLMGEVGKSPHVQSRAQALAIAYAKERKRAEGGDTEEKREGVAGLVDRELPQPEEPAKLIPMSPALPAYIDTIMRLHEARKRAQGIDQGVARRQGGGPLPQVGLGTDPSAYRSAVISNFQNNVLPTLPQEMQDKVQARFDDAGFPPAAAPEAPPDLPAAAPMSTPPAFDAGPAPTSEPAALPPQAAPQMSELPQMPQTLAGFPVPAGLRPQNALDMPPWNYLGSGAWGMPMLQNPWLLRGFAKGGNVKRTQASVHYRDDRGSPLRHCGNCSMFRGPHGCTAVQGTISKAGKCDIWAR